MLSRKKHAFLVPLGVINRLLLFMMGAAMGVGRDTYDIVKIMQELGFGWWGFFVLWLAQWTSQLVNGYSLGLSACNMADVKTERVARSQHLLRSVLPWLLLCWAFWIVSRIS